MSHDAETITRELGQKLAARGRHVCLFLGAGASCAAGLPDIAALRSKVISGVDAADHDLVEKYITSLDVEGTLSRLRAIASLTEDGGEIDGIDSAKARVLDTKISEVIIDAVSIDSTHNLESFERLGSWAGRTEYSTAVEIFTLNYDLLVEVGLESVGALWFDGFVGNLRAPFRDDLVDDAELEPRRRLPPTVTRLWKLHGSVNWRWHTPATGARHVVRVGDPDSALPAAIYPSYEKYEESRRMPFVVLMDRLRRSLAVPETIVFVAGYSFSDDHFNELIFHAAQRHPRSEIVVLSYASIPDKVAECASDTRNLLALGRSEAIVGGQRAGWGGSEVPRVYEGGEYRLGDFGVFSAFLSQQAPATDAGE